MKSLKKVFAFTLVFVFSLVVFSVYAPTVMANNESSSTLLTTDEINEIINQSKKISGNTNKNFNVVSGANAKTMSTDSNFLLQSITEDENGDIILTTVMPYKMLENGEMIDSFQYALQRSAGVQASVEVPTTFVDVTITVTTYFAKYQCADFAWVYRHAGIEAYWSSSNPTVSVSNMLVWYDTMGDLYAYPSVVNNGVINSTCLQEDYFIRSTINKSNPTKGTVYIDGSHTMPYDRVVYLSDYFNHMGLIYLKLNYVANGTSYEHDRSYTVYTK
jgi:hypothetical protein